MSIREPTVAVPPYEALARVYDRWTVLNNYQGWSSFLRDQWAGQYGPMRRVLELCCGTGTMCELLSQQGLEVIGLDASAAMLEQARQKLDGRVRFVQAQLPEIPLDDSFDSIICVFDSMNYLPGAASFAATLQSVARVLRPGGTFIFDLNTRKKLEDIFGSSHYGDDLGDFAYIWRNRFDPQAQAVDFLITLFIEERGTFQRYFEQHRQTIFEPACIRQLAVEAGFTVRAVLDDYSERSSTSSTLRETWVLVHELPGSVQ